MKTHTPHTVPSTHDTTRIDDLRIGAVIVQFKLRLI
jgi:hypothetical protein